MLWVEKEFYTKSNLSVGEVNMLKKRAEEAEQVLQDIALSLSVGGAHPFTNAKDYAKRIDAGIDMLTKPLTDLIDTLRTERAKMQDENDMLRHDLRQATKAPAESG